jgi:hypothetical protein
MAECLLPGYHDDAGRLLSLVRQMLHVLGHFVDREPRFFRIALAAYGTLWPPPLPTGKTRRWPP